MNIKVYTTPGCGKCKVLKSKLEQKGIGYEEISDMEVIRQKGFLSAPTLEIDDVVLNFGEAINWVNERN